MVKEMAVLKVCFYFLLIPLAGADASPCANTETEAIYRGRNRWTLPDPFLAYNNTDMHSCSVFCRKNTQCESFAFAEGTCSLYTIQVAKNTRRLVRDKSSVHFDSLPIPNRSPEKSYIGACSNGNLCQHGSICENDCTDRGYSCVCAKGFRGINCEHGVSDTFSLETIISVDTPGRIEHFHFNGNVYIVVPTKGSSRGLLMFRYNVKTAASEEIQFIADDSINENIVFTKGEDIYVSMGLIYTVSERIKTYQFNRDTEQLEELFDKMCGRCTAAFLLDSRGDASWFNARYKNPDRLTDSHMYSFTGTHLGSQYTQAIPTKGITCSHIFEMDGYNVLFAGNTLNDNGSPVSTTIYLQPHDYGRPKTASVFAIFILTEDWTLVFKAVSGVNHIDLYTLWSTAGSRNEGNPKAMELDDTFRDHYKSSLVDTWENVVKVKLAFYGNAKSKFSLIFNAEGTTNLDWFTKDRLLNYPWTDLKSKTPASFEMNSGVTGRMWVISDTLDTCETDVHWMMVTSHEGCNFEQTEPRPMFLYSDQKTSMVFHSDVFLGCYLDDGPNRYLSSYILTSPGVTAWDCLELCRGLDFVYAGVDILNTACYCGDSGYSTGGVTNCQGRTASDATLMMRTVATWVYHQSLSEPNDPKYIDSFRDNDGHFYVIVQNREDLYTLVYKWSKHSRLFEIHQKIKSQYEIQQFELLEAYKRTYLILVAYSDLESSGDDFMVEAEFWRFEGKHFVKHLTKSHCRSSGWDSFVVDNQVYVIEGSEFGPPCTTSNADGNLKIYKWI